MTRRVKSKKSNGIIFILSGLLYLIFLNPGFANQQSEQLTQSEFTKELCRAYTDNDEQLAISLIRNHRLFVKPAVNELIKECILLELKGKERESQRAFRIAERAATSFENIFREKSLSIGVSYLKAWSGAQKEKKLVADSLYALGTGIRSNEKKRDQAVQCYNEAFDIYKDIGDKRGEAEILGGLGLIYSAIDSQKSMSFYRQALKIREEVDDKQLIGNSLNSIGVVFNNSGEFTNAIPYFDRAEELRLETGDMPNLRRTQSLKAGAYLSLGEELNNTGRYREALENLERALGINNNLNSGPGIGEVLNQMGFVYSNLGDYTTAAEKINNAIKIMEEENDSSGLAGACNHLGIVLQMSGRLEKASEYFHHSLKIFEELDDKVNIIALLSNLGTLFFDDKDYVRAEEYLKRALQISREIEDKRLEASCLLNLANTLSLLGKTDDGRACYESGLEIAGSLNAPDLIWRFLVGLADGYQRQGEFDRAVELNDSALKIIDAIRSTLEDTELKTSYLAKERFVFEGVISMLGILHEKDGSKGYDLLAYKYAELGKSRAFLELLSESLSKVNEGAETNPKYADLQYPQPVTLEEVQSLIPDKNTVILEYSLGDTSSFLWVITRREHQLFRLPDRKILQEQVESMRFALLDTSETNDGFLIEAGHSLYMQLIKPAESFLSKKSNLVIIPDGILNYLPFEALLTENKDNNLKTFYTGLPFLVKKYPVSYSQSASVLKSLLSEHPEMTKSASGNKTLLAFGDPVYYGENVTSGSSSTGYKRLEFSGKEVEDIASFFRMENRELCLRNDATEDNVKKNEDLKKFNYIHFATHGFVDEEKARFQFSGAFKRYQLR